MNTELTFAVIATVLVLLAVVLTFKFGPRRRELFMVDLLNATLGSASPSPRRLARANVTSRIDPGRRRERGRLPRAPNRLKLTLRNS